MANVYEFIISMKDGISAAAKKASSSIDGIKNNAEKLSAAATKTQEKMSALFSKVTASAVKAVRGPKTLQYSIDELKKKLEKVNQVKFSTHLKKEFNEATKEAQRLEKQISRLEQGISGKGFGSKMAGWRKDFANSLPGADIISNPLTLAGATIGSFWTATEKAMEAGKERMKLQTLTGSKEIGSSLYEGLTKFATDTVFGTEVYDMATQMLANGIKSSDVMPLMEQLGDISMGDADKLGGLSLALAQIQGKGHLAGQELLQLINAGFNPLQIISEKTGESMSSLKDKMEDGKISFNDVRRAMDMATGEGGRFHKMLEQVANTPYGQLEGLKGQLEQMMVKIGSVFIPIASKMMSFFSWLGEQLGPILEPVVIILGSLAAGLLAAAAAQWVLNLALWSNPVGLIVAGIIVLIAVITYLISKISGWGEAWSTVVNNAKLTWEAFTSMIDYYWQKTTNSFMIGLNKIKEGWYTFKNAVGMGEESENNALLEKINQDTENRKKTIENAQKNFDEKAGAFKKGIKNPLDELKWNEKSSLSSTVNNLKNTMMPEYSAVGGLGKDDKKKEKKKGRKKKEASDGIISGGSKQTNITINIDKVGTDTKIYVSSKEEGLSSFGERVREELLRAINSVNQLQT